MSELTGSNHRCRAQFKCAQTVVGDRFAGNGPNGLSYYDVVLLLLLSESPLDYSVSESIGLLQLAHLLKTTVHLLGD